MEESQISAREQKLREEYPKMFQHEGALPGEVFLGNQLVDVVEMNVQIYRREGMPSARFGEKPVMGKLSDSRDATEFPFHPVFVDLRELILAEQRTTQAKC